MASTWARSIFDELRSFNENYYFLGFSKRGTILDNYNNCKFW